MVINRERKEWGNAKERVFLPQANYSSILSRVYTTISAIE